MKNLPSASRNSTLVDALNITKNSRMSGQVVVEYVMILTLVVAALATTKIKVDTFGNIDVSGKPGSKTVMELLSQSFTLWMQDMLIIISLPS